MILGFFNRLQAIHDDEQGATAIEYGLLAALIAAVIITAVIVLGDNLADVFDFISDEIGDAF